MKNMAPSTKNTRPSAKEEIKQQEILQAVVIADNFNDKLYPVTISKPSVLLPVVNAVLLDYVLNSLEECGIQETFIFCCAHNQQIRSYISSSKWSDPGSSMSVSIISSSTFLSVGDTLRELDAKALIRTDFILIRGDVIFNFPLSNILEEHKKRRQEDKGCAITLIYRKALPCHSIRSKEDDFLIAVSESDLKKIRYYSRVNTERSFSIPLEVFQANEFVTIRNDLLDMHMSVCSPCVPPLFSDNFDYQTMDDFVKGLLVNEELLGNSMYIHVVKKGYGASLSNFYMYNAVSQHILSRWTYPLVPDLLASNGNKYSHCRPNIYMSSNVSLGKNCILKQNVAVGEGTKIGNNCIITHSVIGNNCSIGDNVEIRGSYVWSNVKVGDNCKLDKCLLADNVTLRKNITIKPGCILGNEVMIGDNIVLNECTKLQSQALVEEKEECFGDDFTEQESPEEPIDKTCDVNLVGVNGLGYLCQSSCESDDEEGNLIADVWGQVADESTLEYDSESSSSEILSPGDIPSDASDGAGGDFDDDTALFYAEVLESLQRGIEENIKSENLILEINSSKHAYNVEMREVNNILIKVILKMPLENQDKELTAQEYFSSVKKNLVFFLPLVSNYIRSAESQMECLRSIEEFMTNYEKLSPAVIKVIHFWYDKDILTEPVILKWFRSPENEPVKKPAEEFVKWLEEADEESSEDEDE